MEWLVANWDGVLAVLGAVVALATAVAPLTPTKTDDKFAAWLVKFVQMFAINGKPQG